MVYPDHELFVLGNNLRQRRKDRGWTQEEMAARAGLNKRHYQDVETGKAEIGVKNLGKIHRALGEDWNATMADFVGCHTRLTVCAPASDEGFVAWARSASPPTAAITSPRCRTC